MDSVCLGGRAYRVDVLSLRALGAIGGRNSFTQAPPTTQDAVIALRQEALGRLFAAFPELERNRAQIESSATFEELTAVFYGIADAVEAAMGVQGWR